MRHIGSVLLKGLVAVLPVGLTLYLIYWLGLSIERILHPIITFVIPERFYLPGMGLAAGIVLLFFIGLGVNAWIVQRLLHLGESLLEKIPLVKSVYGALRDFISYFSSADERGELTQVVMVSIADVQVLGFLTREHVRDIRGAALPSDAVAVYLPMSYQIGGYTVYLPRSRIQPVDMSMEEAMRQVLTAGLSKAAALRNT